MNTKTYLGLLLFNMMIVGIIGLCLVSLLVYAPMVFVVIVLVVVSCIITYRQMRKEYRRERMLARMSKRR
ncbi:MAG TPA: hypothetical protein PLW93_02085 [Candidatus Absconditabacterales bacterium]|nr:hypothetical protein [Candidatus Absconditabacterales bacterium]HNG97039.1 hypothetical protein [Candidatus Absconditabacterales bacterium]